MSLDPQSPVPLYHQIAEDIRRQLASGELRPGDALEPMRRAAERFGVNLHTVRHAYAALQREGLLESRPALGTRVTSKARDLSRETPETAKAFVARIAREAHERHGMRTQELADAVAALEETTSLPTVALVECSLWQCESHAAELTARWRLDVVPWPLGQEGEPQADTVVATYFHYNDVRRRWPHLLDRVRFLTLRVEPGLEQWLSPTDAVHVVEWDAPTAEAVAADLRAVLGPDRRIEEVVTTSPDSVLSELGDARVLFSPRAWSELGESARRDPRCRVVRYVFDDSELLTLARDLGWQPVRDRQGALR